MAQFFQIHPQNPQPRLIFQAAEILQSGGIAVYPTDATYALGCCLGNHAGIQRILQLRGLSRDHLMTLLCLDLKELSVYAEVDNTAFRLIKSLIPGPYTFILKATREVPKKLLHPKQKTVGLRVPNNNVLQHLLKMLQKPLVSTTLLLPGEELPVVDIQDEREKIEQIVDLMIDSGPCDIEYTTMIDLTSAVPQLIRQGKGDVSAYLIK